LLAGVAEVHETMSGRRVGGGEKGSHLAGEREPEAGLRYGRFDRSSGASCSICFLLVWRQGSADVVEGFWPHKP
jgi:hypothetical protein